MAHLGLIITGSPFDSQRWRTGYELGLSALETGHQVTYFHYLDGVYVPVSGQDFPDASTAGIYDDMPSKKYRKLLEKGASILCCGLCIDARGLDREQDYPDGVEIGLLPDLADLVGEADKVISL